MLGSPCFRAELPVEPAPTRGVKRPANQITTTSIQNGSAGFRSHCERLLRCAEPESKRFKAFRDENLPNVRLTFEDLPNIVFDSSSIGVYITYLPTLNTTDFYVSHEKASDPR